MLHDTVELSLQTHVALLSAKTVDPAFVDGDFHLRVVSLGLTQLVSFGKQAWIEISIPIHVSRSAVPVKVHPRFA